ncbi:polyprenol phosphomannose-dependent alpha 1,6 mannosyltransferase MptB [Tersicoccus sp. MR15.9]|uniref:polyprenol phosphomannose-dependent alpha 1,6 mannosyltransferase MptB n=1 Tax=Tersicoccus mangrovi TaxID=3121635 RepID=UPI002FE5E9ED
MTQSPPAGRTPAAESEGAAATEPRRIRRPSSLIQGLVGSLLLIVGSLGVGWLPGSSPLRQNPVIIPMRFTTTGVVVSVVLLAVGGMLLIRAWLRLGQQVRDWSSDDARRSVLRAIGLWGIPMYATIPLFSRDVYSYIAQGLVMVNGLDPYHDGVSSIEGFFQRGADQLWSESPPPYGPLFLGIEQGIVTVTGANLEWSVMLFRLSSLIGILLCLWAVPKLARLHGIDPTRALWLSVANPLFLTNFIAAAHNDALMIGLAVAGIYLTAVRRPILGIVLVTASVGIKPITIVFLPFLGLMWAGRGASWPRRIGYCAITGLISLALIGGAGVLNGLGFGWIGALSTTGNVWIWYAPVGLIGLMVATGLNAFGLDGWGAATIVHTLGKVVGFLVVIWLFFVGNHEKLIRRMTLAMAAVVVFSPMIQSWYVVWLLPLFAVTGVRDDWQVRALFLVMAFLMIYAITDQLDVFPYLNVDLNLARQLAAVIGVGFALYLIFVDPRTSRLFRKKFWDASRPLTI